MRAPAVLIPALTIALAAGQALAQQPAAFAEPTRAAPTSAVAMKSSFAPVVQRAAPAVVNISAKRVVRQQVDPFWQMFGLGVPQSRVAQSLGSGVIVRADGIDFAGRLQVYRNNTFSSLTAALKDSFPVVCQLVDERFFGYAAQEYIRDHPPRAPRSGC